MFGFGGFARDATKKTFSISAQMTGKSWRREVDYPPFPQCFQEVHVQKSRMKHSFV